MNTEKVDINEAKKIFKKKECIGLLSLVEYLEKDFSKTGKKLLDIHVSYGLTKGMHIGDPASEQTCLTWCQVFAGNISKISKKELLKIDLVISEAVTCLTTPECTHSAKVF